MTATTTLNGKPPRKQLSDQLDRLDSIIDALADGLPAAVAEACREGTRAAVRDAMLEILTNPDLRTLLTAPPTSPQAPRAEKPSAWSWLKDRLKAARTAVIKAVAPQVAGVIGAWTTMTTAVRTITAVFPVQRIVLTGLFVGAVVGVISYVAPHGVSAVLSGIGGLVTAVTVQVGACVRRSIRLFGFRLA